MKTQVHTTSGTVQGTMDANLPCSEVSRLQRPPVGRHRFAAPVSPDPWNGVLDVTAFGSPPPQPGSQTTDDNWLTLAVWTSMPERAGLPVVVWFSGGGYLNCNAANPHLDGRTMAAAGVIVVSAHYRSGFEGFAYLEDAPANRGLLDQLAALRWVRDNINAFGGDPENVTALGQSAGAGAIAALLAMPASEGLFRRAILQSIPGTYLAPLLATDIAKEICGRLGRSPRVDDLTDVAPAQLVEAARTVTEELHDQFDRWGSVVFSSTPFAPVVDGEVLQRAPWAALSEGASRDVELVIGHTRDEYSLLALDLPTIEGPQLDRLVDELSPTPGTSRYRETYASATPGELRELVLSDWLYRMPTIHLAEAAQAGGARVWMYELCWGFGSAGASHGLDALLLFGTAHIDTGLTEAGSKAMSEGQQLSELIRTELLTFAAGSQPGWETYEPVMRATRVYDTSSAVIGYPEGRSREIWRHHRFGVLKLP